MCKSDVLLNQISTSETHHVFLQRLSVTSYDEAVVFSKILRVRVHMLYFFTIRREETVGTFSHSTLKKSYHSEYVSKCHLICSQ